MKEAILTPAYGRDYESAVQAEGDWLANRDFVLNYGPARTYVNRAQVEGLKEEGFTSVRIRYKKLERFVIIPL